MTQINDESEVNANLVKTFRESKIKYEDKEYFFRDYAIRCSYKKELIQIPKEIFNKELMSFFNKTDSYKTNEIITKALVQSFLEVLPRDEIDLLLEASRVRWCVV